ncbi:protease complex subunit PrcB family protein [Patescibacteria group bacterium]|nr:protease complex subunit PrcB family protein [Patescibacteria group bacterium]
MKKDTLILIGVVLVALVAGSAFFFLGRGNSTTSSAVADTQPLPAAVPFTEVAQGSKSTVTTRVNYAITSADQLNKLWKMVDATGTPPKVDFKTQAVIAVFMGEKPTTGYAIKISKVEDSSARKVSVTLVAPSGSCATGQSLTAPYEIVVVPATSLPLEHEDIPTTKGCP